ncbi:uncharacterized protein LAESUDRAFT_808741 [Laetiporus sulphureus 93-53]|uniref:DUF6533 domain-containing protein n=1 Tax=Laetiporus sulphureus 93-53 TaxID=1314785 RepID=A0A165HHU6_9APHY|nr:uncharacterized protein LAESUDRAFT_808741 [Laetiporus sulphureus 93-53]KZT11752.1 hypothetical protein LAESUDRAFT_808741 [Laetiporus sulphureus 93-53]
MAVHPGPPLLISITFGFNADRMASTLDHQDDIIFIYSNLISDRCTYVVVSVLVYEHLITVPDEVSFLWRGTQFTFVTALFLLNRYLLLLMAMALSLSAINWNTALGCEATLVLYQCIGLAMETNMAVLRGLRVYAINEQNWLLAILTFSCGLAPVCMNIYTFVTRESPSYIVRIGGRAMCADLLRVYSNLEDTVIAPARIFRLVSDLLVILVTLHKTFSVARTAHQANIHGSIGVFLLKNATHYFSRVLVMNILGIVLWSELNDLQKISVILVPNGFFMATTSSLMMTRFILDLRGMSRGRGVSPSDCDLDAQAQSSGPVSRFVGDLGADLQNLTLTSFAETHGEDEEEEEDEEDCPRSMEGNLLDQAERAHETVV